LYEAIRQLRRNPTTRQVVLQMWGAGRNDLISETAKPCNLVTAFRIRGNRLDMTVFNRSNDLIWGCCGANAVHFAVMQEYIASMIGIEIGSYWQVTTNLHLYQHHIDMFRKRIFNDHDITIAVNIPYHLIDGIRAYEQTQPLIQYPETFDNDLEDTMAYIDALHMNEKCYDGNIANPFLRDTVIPMATTHRLYKNKQMDDALEEIKKVSAPDWRTAGEEWLLRRQK
jgi:Thymidylate synthase